MLLIQSGEKVVYLRNVMGTFIGMSESRKDITNSAETATNVPCDSTNKRRTIRPATNILTPPLDSVGTPGPPENPPPHLSLLHLKEEGEVCVFITGREGTPEDPRAPTESEVSRDPSVCVYCYKAVRGGGGWRVEDMSKGTIKP